MYFFSGFHSSAPIDEHEHHVDEHEAAVIQRRVEPRRRHRQAEEGLGHILGPDRRADDIVHEKARHAADDRADEEAALELRARAGKAEHCEREQIVADERLPRPGIRAAEHRLQNAVGKACKHAGAEAPAGAVQEDRQHLDRDGAALRELERA